MQSTRIKNAFRIIFIICMIGIAIIGVYDYMIPDSISVFAEAAETDIARELNLPFVTADLQGLPTVNIQEENEDNIGYSTREANTKIFGVVPLKTVNVDVFKDISLYPGGMPFGVKLYTDGVILAGITDVETFEGKKAPASEGGLRVGDVIKAINGKALNTTDEISSAIEQSGGNSITFTVKRGGKELTLDVTPVLSAKDKIYRAGMWLRDSTAGIGTVTFITADKSSFAGLGHGICDVDTGEIMPLRRGSVVDVTIKGITKGVTGSPGELKGVFLPGKLGTLIGNKTCGVYGILTESMAVNDAEPLKIGLKDELKTGDAEIICTVGEKTERYGAKIIKIGNKDGDQKNFVIKITDKRLLEATGGIVQGMSGSPVIQNGKLVGAVTHVLVNDPTKGYGIFIENMLKNMPEILG